jgi:hypothetical protein
MRRQAGPDWILSNIENGIFEGVTIAFILSQHMIVSGWLQRIFSKCNVEMLSQKTNGESLIGVPRRTEKEHVKMIGHQAVRGTNEGTARACVQEEDAEFVVKRGTKPTGSPILDSHRPMHPGKTLVELSVKTTQMPWPGRLWEHCFRIAAAPREASFQTEFQTGNCERTVAVLHGVHRVLTNAATERWRGRATISS